MTSVTLAVSDGRYHVPGFAVEAVAGAMFMHDPAVRNWIADHRPAEPGAVMVADPGWVNPGDGTESLTFPVDDRDAETVAAHWEKISTSCTPADEPAPQPPARKLRPGVTGYPLDGHAGYGADR